MNVVKEWGRFAFDVARAEPLRARLRREFPRAHIGMDVYYRGPISHIKLAPDVHLQKGVFLEVGSGKWCEKKGSLTIGARSSLSPYVVIYAAGPGVVIGEDVDIAPGVGIYSSRTDENKGPGHHIFGQVVIGDRVIINAGAIISPGVTIGDDAVIEAGSVVTEDVPKGVLVGGVPARVIKTLPPRTA